MSGYSSGIYLLAKLQKEGKISISPKKIICSADPMTGGMRDEIYSAFGVNPISFYASSESICLGAQQKGEGEIYLFNDFHIFELLDQSDNYSKLGEPGKLILTNLYNYAQPLIRYEMNDELVMSKKEKKFENKWRFPVLQQISGRSEEFLWFRKKDNKMDYIHPIVFVEYYVPGLEKFQIIQKSENSFDILAEIDTREYTEEIILSAMRRKMNAILQEKGFLNEINFNINLTNFIQSNDKTGKIKLIIPLKK